MPQVKFNINYYYSVWCSLLDTVNAVNVIQNNFFSFIQFSNVIFCRLLRDAPCLNFRVLPKPWSFIQMQEKIRPKK